MSLKQAFLRVARVLAVGLASVAALEWNGHPLLSSIDRTARRLTPGEVTLARTVFGDTIDYDRVRLFARPYMGVASRDFHTTVSPNGHIYSRSLRADYAAGTLPEQSHFLHEMTHVWQHQNGRSVRAAALAGWVRSKFNYFSLYAYEDRPDRRFDRMNIEQQADMVADYHFSRSVQVMLGCPAGILQPVSAGGLCDATAAQARRLAERLRPHLPLGGDVPRLVLPRHI